MGIFWLQQARELTDTIHVSVKKHVVFICIVSFLARVHTIKDRTEDCMFGKPMTNELYAFSEYYLKMIP